MALRAERTDEILDILRERGIDPHKDFDGADLPDIGEVEEGETIYSTSIAKVFGEQNDESTETTFDLDDDRLNEWWGEIEQIIENGRSDGPFLDSEPGQRRAPRGDPEPPEPYCAWYCPIHFFGHSWGIYIRESCILSSAIEIARFVNWRIVPQPFSRRRAVTRQLLRSAFYIYYLHEQFHHKVESLGFRLLIATGSDRYRPYKANVYRRSFRTPECLEESLANAESYRRLSEQRYRKRHEKPIVDGLRSFLKESFRLQPPGYAEAVNYLSGLQYRDGLYQLQSQALDGKMLPTTPPLHWSIAPKVITSLMDISDDIYLILSRGARPIIPTSIDPGTTISSKNLVGALTKHHGYHQTAGGKGSHVKLTKPGAPNIHIPGNRAVVSPGVVKQALNAIGGHPISRLPDLLAGRLT